MYLLVCVLTVSALPAAIIIIFANLKELCLRVLMNITLRYHCLHNWRIYVYSARGHVPSLSVLKRTIRNHRTSQHPPQPKQLSDLDVTGVWATTGGAEPADFLVYDNGTDAESRMLVFAAKDCLQHLGASNTWFMDGNFAVAPTLFKQVIMKFSCFISVNNTSIASAMC